jgi:hypothetical protein
MRASEFQDHRFKVPDLSPQARPFLSKMKPKWVFVAESPHLHEIEPESIDHRRPLCGKAGQVWWRLLSELLEKETSTEVSLERLLKFCWDHQIVILNAVQFPLDPKIAIKFPEADPVKNLGFSKASGPHSFKKLKSSRPVQQALDSLGKRLRHPALKEVPVICLGNDAEWFVRQALVEEEISARLKEKVPHPSAWWRRGGYFGRVAKDRLKDLLSEFSCPVTED